MADKAQPSLQRDQLFRPRSRGRPRVRSPESARRFQRECIRQMQATRVYLGTAYQRWRSLSFLFKRTSDMAKHLLDVHEQHCTVCYPSASSYSSFAPPPRKRRAVSDRDDNEDPQPATVTSAAHYPMSYSRLQQCNNNNNVASTSYLPPLTRIPETATNRQMTTTDISDEIEVHLPPMPPLNPFIKQEPDEPAEEAIDLTRDATLTSSSPSENNVAHSSSSSST